MWNRVRTDGAVRLQALAVVVVSLIGPATADSSILPYPRSPTPTGAAGPIWVVDASAITDHADRVTLQTLAGVLARR